MSHPDQLHRYLFENHAVRGELVTVSETWREIIQHHDYPQPVQQLLGELLVATSLLTATLKFEGDITVQLQGDGPLSLAVINGNHQQEMRGIARVKDSIAAGSSLLEMVGKGCLVITITPSQGERYQGVVELTGETLAACLEEYFMRSEQLPTRLFIHTRMDTEHPGAAGMLLQVLPAADSDRDDFGHLAALTDTLKTAELLDLPARDVLWRLYHQEEVRIYDPQPIRFHCGCSRERCSEVLKTLPEAEVDEILAEEGKIDMHCDYCGSHYLFDAVDIAALRKVAAGGNPRMH